MPVVCKAWGKGVEKVKLRRFSEVDDAVTAISYIKHIDCSSVESVELFITEFLESDSCLPGLAAAIEVKFLALRSLDLRMNGGANNMKWLRLLRVNLRHLCIGLYAESNLESINHSVNLERFEMDFCQECIIHGDLTLPQLKQVVIKCLGSRGLAMFVDLTLARVLHSCVLMTNLSKRSFPAIQATCNFVFFD